ncbi:MAG: hypothetical protein IPO26_13710 [Saprospiraceae bacterium]|nr:hypothetical protein [Saprospiraceae bacterium]
MSGDAYVTLFPNGNLPDFDKVNTAIVDNFFFWTQRVSKSFRLENKWEFSLQFDIKVAYNYATSLSENEGIKQDLPFVPT